MKKIPEGVELTLTFYFTSDSTGLNLTVGLTGNIELLDVDIDAESLISKLPQLANDWRLMTTAEIAEYKEDEDAA